MRVCTSVHIWGYVWPMQWEYNVVGQYTGLIYGPVGTRLTYTSCNIYHRLSTAFDIEAFESFWVNTHAHVYIYIYILLLCMYVACDYPALNHQQHNASSSIFMIHIVDLESGNSPSDRNSTFKNGKSLYIFF